MSPMIFVPAGAGKLDLAGALTGKLPGGGHTVYCGGPGGEFIPGDGFSALIAARNGDSLRGACGIYFEHRAVVGVANETRGVIAALLQHLFRDRPFFVMDELSVEWAGHYGLGTHARVGGSIWWLDTAGPGSMRLDVRQRAEGTAKEAFVTVCGSVFQCFIAARAGVPMLLLPTGDGGPGCAAQDSYSPVRRWAATYGMLDALCSNEAEVQAKLATARAFPAERLTQERARAIETLQELCAPAPAVAVPAVTSFEPATEVDGELRAALAKALGGPRIVKPGDVFDPATHYDANYYAGPEGHGIRYMQPDGSWTTYHGPAKKWDGNKVIARKLTRLLQGDGLRLLDIGCGAGDFVNCMHDFGWDAWGVDISEAAAKGNPRVRCADFADGGLAGVDDFDLVTALDFWEHIWTRDLDRLIDATRTLLAPKGLHLAIICTRGAAEADFVAEPGVRFTKENSWLLVSGHVHIRDWRWWARTFKRHGFRLRHDLAYLFQVQRTEDPGLSLVKSWQAKNLLVLEKR